MFRASRDRHAFSLLELLVVLVVIGVAAALTGPSLIGTLDRSRSRTLLEAFAGDLHYARMLAIRHGRPAEVRPRWDAAGRCIEEVSVVLGGHAERVVRRTRSAQARLCLSMNNTTSPIVFGARGLPSGVLARSVWVERRDQTDSLRVSQLGRAFRAYR